MADESAPKEFLITTGLVSLLFATIQQRQNIHLLRARYRGARICRSLAAVLATLISLLGFLSLWPCFSGNDGIGI